MDTFALIVESHRRYFNRIPEIKVAIIDDGVDPKHPTLQGHIADGKSFRKRMDIPERMVDYWVNPGGHGTVMADLVCRICPAVRLYIIRLDEGKGENGERQIKVDSATDVRIPFRMLWVFSEHPFYRQ
jgi:Subtilase family